MTAICILPRLYKAASAAMLAQDNAEHKTKSTNTQQCLHDSAYATMLTCYMALLSNATPILLYIANSTQLC